ncbi:MAG: twin-arginine translocation signal domain-containing protein, partial [bacterium]
MDEHVSRRDFIKKTAVITLAAVVPISVVSDAAAAFAAPKPKIDKPGKKIQINKAKLQEFKGKKIIWPEKGSAEYKKMMLPKIHLPLIA